EPQRLEYVGADRGESNLLCVCPRLRKQKQQQRMIGIAERRDADRSAFQILDGLDRIAVLRGDGKREQRQSARRRKASDGRAVRKSLQCDVKRGASVFDGAADERLHGGIATSRVHELDVEALLGE